jgi:hypothetical protein
MVSRQGGNMNRLKHAFWILATLLIFATGTVAAAQDNHVRKEGAYLVVEGVVTQFSARMLVIDGQQYPISMFARVFVGSLKGQESSVQTLANIGRVDQARLYLLGGKVEKIVVIKNL